MILSEVYINPNVYVTDKSTSVAICIVSSEYLSSPNGDSDERRN